ncbi:MAG: acylphosphatase [Gammaproteobacteria bacterium]|nr:acylphosphatase [Gammaproteobacteria bacterium]NIM72858.1 acylphosphatase [Gammaproteobacteria bacterium]NIN38316.1 acylphosphatase [Gammaproteobacteria bacterium]NIO24606.1 acylphosphatase [Gammaproteobacteria bacterium]NIO65215.1 acylphosphatase [Gammaproteobacteria bacterium]
MAECCRRCHVSGRVQGVGFRFATRQQGRVLGIAVSARNLADGRVEVIARGPQDAVDELCGWLRCGPAHARVVDVACETLPPGRWPDVDAG